MSSVNYNGHTLPIKNKLPRSASAGEYHAVKLKNSRVAVFQKTSKTGFGSWVIRANMPM